MLEIVSIDAGGIADELGLEPGDYLLSVNGEPINDLVDYLIEEPSEFLRIELKRKNGDLWELEVEHDSDDPLGIELPHPEPRQCGNNCVFCFVHQLPRGMRKTLYVKDEDYRFSFLYGAYVTLTNLSEDDLERILKKRLSPLYVSVHATDNVLRQELLGKPAPEIMPLLKRLVDGGIEVHTQVVVCPRINDGQQLEQTCRELVSLAPGVKSLAVVPVGLTGHRRGLYDLRAHTRAEAAELVAWIEMRQQELVDQLGMRFIYAADELYLKAELEFPPVDSYEDFAQVENGVGLIPLFREEANEVLDETGPMSLPPVSLVTGESAAGELIAFAEMLGDKCGIELHVHVVKNLFFGGHVTVAGLLTGRDLLEQLKGAALGKVLLVPDVMLREGEDVFLDDLTVQSLAETLGVDVEVVPASPWGIMDMLDTLAMEDWSGVSEIETE